ncbi:MAG TPA: ORF6N domain-containing protein [Alloprevotella sp.]|nr:ORF6N domain-containing protein [Alloprevotella sp.]
MERDGAYTCGPFPDRNTSDNIEKFGQDFMFQLSDEWCEILRCKNSTSSWGGGRRYSPYAFTEQGIYMLMTVLKGDLATKRSKALIRIIKQMKMSTQHFCYAIHHSKCPTCPRVRKAPNKKRKTK